MADDALHLQRLDALARIEAAIAACDRIGENTAACHLQLGADLLKASLLRAEDAERSRRA